MLLLPSWDVPKVELSCQDAVLRILCSMLVGTVVHSAAISGAQIWRLGSQGLYTAYMVLCTSLGAAYRIPVQTRTWRWIMALSGHDAYPCMENGVSG